MQLARCFHLILLLTIIISTVFSQERDWKNLELFIGCRGLAPNQKIIIKMQGLTTLYDINKNIIPNSQNSIYQYPPSISNVDWVGNTVLTTSPMRSWLGFNLLTNPTDYDAPPPLLYLESSSIGMETYYYGLYTVKAEIINVDTWSYEVRGEFYFDIRDINYPGYIPPLNGHSTDIWFKYEANLYPYFFIRSYTPRSDDYDPADDPAEVVNQPYKSDSQSIT